ncbi:GntR family transcriptional regulator [Sinorhizobium meliloti]|uniref:GntR family transcriptional regulator n=1 Tax=Rhizobium meliloti TaxID=382 RepID=UPI000477D3DD|nr:GntR family transcriptional regulator [Sinorhizobium meliloti]
MESVTRGHRSREVYSLLKEEILDLTFSPGAALDEVSLAKRFRTSRTPVRHALQRLALEELILPLPCRTAVVSQIDYLNLGAFFDAYVLMTRATVRLAAINYRLDNLASVKMLNRKMVAASNARHEQAILALNAEFHLALAHAGGNPYYSSTFERLLNTERRILRLRDHGDARVIQHHSRQHAAIISAVQRRDVDEADYLAGRHAEEGVKIMQSHFLRWAPFSIDL